MTSIAPDITEGIPTPLSRAVEQAQAYASTGTQFDVSIGGVAFFAAASDQRPYLRQSAPIQKQQIDTSKDAGEQTLDGQWIRSQTSWHHGAGARFYEPGSDPVTQHRFEDSLGVDVFTRDKVTLLRSCSVVGAVSASQVAYATGAIVGGADVVFTNENGVIKRRSSTGTLLQSYTPTAATPGGPVAVGGTKIYVGATSFGIDYADASGTALSRLYNQALGTTPIPYWVKARLIATRGRAIYELAPDGTSGAGDIDAATALYTHPDTGWTWSSVAESPSAILASGYSNGRSAIYRFSLEDAASGTTPELSQAYQAAEFPIGEEVLSLHVYLGTYIGIGTTKGVRVGVVSDRGEIQYGPLLVECGPVRDLDAADRFLYGAVTAAHPDGNSGLVVVDLSEQVVPDSLQFPYAWHARTGTTGRADSVTTVGASGLVAVGVFGEGVYLQSATDYEATGYITSGRIRYATVEQKLFRVASLGASVADGAVSLYVVDGENETFVRRLDSTSADGSNISLARVSGTFEFLQLKTVLTSGDESPTLDSLQIRALPAPAIRHRLIQYPLLCMDLEQSPTGTKTGREGWAKTRLMALEEVESAGAAVLVQDFRLDEAFDAVIETIEFRSPGPRSTDGRRNVGGYLMVTVRKLS